MKTNRDIWADAGVTVLDQDELMSVRGGFPLFWVGVAAGLLAGAILDVWNSWDEFKEGLEKGWNWCGEEYALCGTEGG